MKQDVPPGIAGSDPLAQAWAMPGAIGAEIGSQVRSIEAVLEEVRQVGALSTSQLRVLQAAAEELHRVGLAAQQVTRLRHGRIRQSHERIDLARVLGQVVEENVARYDRSGIELELHMQQVEVIADPGLVMTVCQTALDCAARAGGRIQVWLKLMNWPEHALLTIRARPHVEDGSRPGSLSGGVGWVLLEALADATGMILRRDAQPQFDELHLEFPRTVKQFAGLTAVEVDGGPGLDSRPLAGHRVLLVSDNEWIVSQVRTICHGMRLSLDVVANSSRAVRFCELEVPELIIVEEVARDAVFEELKADLLRQNINFPLVEIVSTPNMVELANWEIGAFSRLSATELASELQGMLTRELAKVF